MCDACHTLLRTCIDSTDIDQERSRQYRAGRY